ncbi:hypothetical protein SKAU_G00197250 [Synaphobranchus kaupii]|uniref:Uncharacterized protein n=1 Tax=Synaphobranchus kaupii TaxID=118154 RepID=A0A9Q1FEU9_SYNKA|nr:hypothetical protein SKAU_G00197250 [Synaphobranchus kaupii]
MSGVHRCSLTTTARHHSSLMRRQTPPPRVFPVMLGSRSVLNAEKPEGSTSLDAMLLSSQVSVIAKTQALRYSCRLCSQQHSYG